ncbi:MAG: helix-turn-helix domain-containing protein [Salinivirgaceae bacterium]|nr:helix-turn-helix domain-containing protein [Salinivirgaceae bacterium]
MDNEIMVYLQEQFGELQKQILISTKNVLSVKELAQLTGLSTGHIYNLVSAKKIPHYKTEGGKLVFFRKQEVEDWLCATRIPTYKEMEQQAATYCVRKRR